MKKSQAISMLAIILMLVAHLSTAQTSSKKFKGTIVTLGKLDTLYKVKGKGILRIDKDKINYAWFYVEDDIVLLVLETQEGNNFLVRDQLKVPSKGRKLELTFFMCKLNGEEKKGLFGLINGYDNDDFNPIKVIDAWQIIPVKWSIKPIKKGDVVCEPNASEGTF